LATITEQPTMKQQFLTLPSQQLNVVTLWYAHKPAVHMTHIPNNESSY